MLNKELLLQSKEAFPTLEGGFVFKIGFCEYEGSYACGYSLYNDEPGNGGYTSRIPYWLSENQYGVLTRYHLTHFLTIIHKQGIFSTSASTLTSLPSEDDFRFRRIFPNEENASHTDFYIKIPEEEVGKITGYLIYPPPTGTWTQRHSNQSRNRVLCRRSSLGGSRC